MRTHEQITDTEARVYFDFADKHGIIREPDQDAVHNANLVSNYFHQSQLDITPETLVKMFEQLRPQLKIKSAARVEVEKLHQQDPSRYLALVDWFDSQKLLINDGTDQGYQTFIAVYCELKGREITHQRIHQAIGRLTYRVGNQLRYVERGNKPDESLPA